MKYIISNEISPLVRFAHKLVCAKNIMVLNELTYQTYDYRLFFCSEGEITISVEGVKYFLSPGTALYFPSGFKYHYHPQTNKNCILLACNFDLMYSSMGQYESINPDTPENYRPDMQIESIKVEDIAIFNNTIFVENFEHYRSFIELIIDTYKKETLYFHKKCSALLMYVLMGLVSHQTQTTHNIATEIINYIKNNYSQKISNISISQTFNYHTNHLNRIMKHYTGVTLHKYLQNYRVARAIELLNSSNLSIAEIGESVGFDTPQHFCAIFKKITGRQPSAYRPKH